MYHEGRSVFRTCSLLDLPNELIIDILSDTTISLKEIYIVSCVSKRLNILALPIYLFAHGIQEPERKISLYVLDWNPYDFNAQYTDPSPDLTLCRPDTLSGLNISTHISQVKHFKCFFQDPTAATKEWQNSFELSYNLSLAVNRTARFIRRLKYVGMAEIYLIWDPYYVRGNSTATHVPIPELNKWTRSFSRLLDLIVERGCTSLTVQYDAPIEPAFRFSSSNPITKTFSNFFLSVKKRRNKQSPTLLWELERPVHEGKLDPSRVAGAFLSHLARESNSLVTLSIHSSALLLPPFVNWTLSLLYTHSSLTCITFAHLTFSEENWTTLLPLIADAVSDRLTKLSFFLQCTNLTAEILVRFLARLPHLTHLSIDRMFFSRFYFYRTRGNPTSPYLPLLQVLQAPSDLVALLHNAHPPSLPRKNEAPRGPTGLPYLKSLIVYPFTQLQHPEDYAKSTSIINALVSQIKNQPHGREVEYALDLKMGSTDFGPVTHYLQSQISDQKVYLDQMEIEQLTYRDYGSPIAFFDITRVIMFKPNPHQSPTSLCLWLKLLFPRLETLVFTCQINAQPERVSSLDAKVIEDLIKELHTACPTAQTLVVANETYTLSGD